MSFQDQQIQDMLSRLSVLERNDAAKTAEIRSLGEKTTVLQGENSAFQNDVLFLRRENSTLKATVDALSTQLKTIQKRVQKKVKGVEKAVEKNGENISALSVNTQNIEAEFQQVTALRRVLSRTMVDKQILMDLKNGVDDLHKRTYSVERRTGSVEIKADSVEKRTTAVERKADLVENSTVLIENRQENVAQSVTKLMMESNCGGLTTGQSVKLNKWVVKIGNVGVMDTAGDLNVKLDGDYFVGVTFAQFGGGEIKMSVNKLDSVSGLEQFYMGKTVSKDNVCCSVNVRSLKKGDKLWLDAEKKSGNATIGWCSFYIWLLSSS